MSKAWERRQELDKIQGNFNSRATPQEKEEHELLR